MKHAPEDRKYYVHFTREEITHVSMSMELLEQDYMKLRNMTRNSEIEEFIKEKQATVSFTPGNYDDFYEWHSGKECVDGEGERGLFDFRIEACKPTGSRDTLYIGNDQQILTTIPEIKAAVDRGETVYCGNDSYRVIKDNIGQYLIKCDFNDYCIGLHGQEGTKYANKLNGTSFYIKGN